MRPLHDDATMQVIRTITSAASMAITRDEMVNRLIELHSNDISMSTWSALQQAWQANWISADEFERILDVT